MRGRGVVISGGTSGIGLACARRLHEEGARVWILGTPGDGRRARSRAPEGVRGQRLRRRRRGRGRGRGRRGGRRRSGGIDVAVCNAGIDGQGVARARARRRRTAPRPRGQRRRRVPGRPRGARADGRGSAIVVNASVNALRPEAGFLDYNVSKAGGSDGRAQPRARPRRAGYRRLGDPPRLRSHSHDRAVPADESTRAEILEGIPAGRLGDAGGGRGAGRLPASAEAVVHDGRVVTIDGGRSA